MIKKIKSLFYKNDLNYSEGIIDPYKFHRTFYFLSRSFNILDNETKPKWVKPLNLFLFINSIIAMVLSVFGLYRAIDIGDLIALAESVSYALIFIYIVLILIGPKINTANYHQLMYAIREDYRFICAEGHRYRKMFFENQLLTWQICLILLTYDLFIGVSIALVATFLLIFFLMTHTPGDGKKRPLLFPFWFFDVDFSKTPYYEVMFIYSDYTALIAVTVYSFKILTEIMWVRQIAAKADIVNCLLEDLDENIHPTTNAMEKQRYNDLVTHRLRKIGTHLDSMYKLIDEYAAVYKKYLMFEQKLAPIVVTLTAYATAEKLGEGQFHAIPVLLCFAAIAVMFVPCALCSFLGAKVHSIADACLYCKFWITGPIVRPYLVLFIQRSLRPLPLQTAGFESASLETFFGMSMGIVFFQNLVHNIYHLLDGKGMKPKMGSSYSMFNMLRQTNL